MGFCIRTGLACAAWLRRPAAIAIGALGPDIANAAFTSFRHTATRLSIIPHNASALGCLADVEVGTIVIRATNADVTMRRERRSGTLERLMTPPHCVVSTFLHSSTSIPTIQGCEMQIALEGYG